MAAVLGVVPARGGSKSIHKKNIAPLLGHPLIYYTISEARKSRYIERLVVSTDDEEIAQVSQGFGAEVLMRPSEYATDNARTELALIHVLNTLKELEGYEPDIVLTLEPTSPLRSVRLIDSCVEVFSETDADAVISVAENSALVGRVLPDGHFQYLIPNQARRRQDRQPLYRESSTLYATRTEALMKTGSVLGERLYAVIAEPHEAIDINSPIDMVIAEAVMRWLKGKESS